MTALRKYVEEKRIIVCCGAGGVGKTTTSAALALAGARLGRRVLVLTIDPSKRLAETLGVARNLKEPVRLTPEREAEGGVSQGGSLSAWMLDPKLVSDNTVRKLVGNPEEAERLLRNRVYQQVTEMIAGMQEYTAMEALYGFVKSGSYDLVVLDTPPSRNALNFLEAPSRLASFLDGRIFQFFMPKEGGLIRGTTQKLVNGVLSGVFGSEFAGELTTFFGAFASIFSVLSGNAQRMREQMRKDDTTFLLVTSPAQEAVEEARYFEAKIKEMQLPLGGLVLNRSRLDGAARHEPSAAQLGENPPPAALSALAKVRALAERERRLLAAHEQLRRDLQARAGESVPVVPVPERGAGIDTLRELAGLSERLLAASARA